MRWIINLSTANDIGWVGTRRTRIGRVLYMLNANVSVRNLERDVEFAETFIIKFNLPAEGLTERHEPWCSGVTWKVFLARGRPNPKLRHCPDAPSYREEAGIWSCCISVIPSPETPRKQADSAAALSPDLWSKHLRTERNTVLRKVFESMYILQHLPFWWSEVKKAKDWIRNRHVWSKYWVKNLCVLACVRARRSSF